MLKLTDYIGLGNAEYSDTLIGLRISTRLHIGGKAGPSYIDVLLSGVSPLALTNALGLNYIKALGATEQRNLPSDYTQVEYLESSGTQYIDTGIKPNGNYTVIVKGKYNNLGDGTKKMYGSRTGAGSKEFIFTASSQGGSVFTISYGTHTIDATGILSDTNIHIFKLSKGIGYIDNTVAREFTQENFEGDYPLYLFGANYAGTVNGLSNTRIYYEEIYDGNFVLTQNLIPARRNSDNVLGMYDTVTGNFLTNSGTGTFTAGADVVPSPDTPVDIICNNGVLKINSEASGKNAIDTSDTEAGYLSSTVGQQPRINTSTSSIVIKNAIKVSNGKKYKFSYYSNVTGNRESNIVNNNGIVTLKQTLTCTAGLNEYIIQSNADGYLWVTVQLGDFATVQPSVYEIGQIYTDGTQETVNITGKNLLNKNGEFIEFNTAADYIGIPVPNGTYTCSTNIPQQSVNDRNAWFDNQNETFSSTVNGVSSNNSRTVTTNSGMIYFAIRKSYKSSLIDGTYWVQIEAGSTATTYEPYTVLGTANAEMLLKVGDYKDNHELLTGNVTRNVGIKVFDGTEDWTYNNSAFLMNLSDRLPQKKFMFCTHFNYDSGSSTAIPNLCIGGSGAANTIFIKYQTYNTLEQFKQYLADQYANGTPVIVLYPLQTSTTEQVTRQSLTASGNCTVTATGSLDNLELELSYKQGVTVRVQEANNENLDNQVNVTIS